MSRCTTPCACAFARPSATSAAISSASATGSGPRFELLLQRLAFVVRHDDEQLPIVGLLDVVDDADVAVVGRGRGLRFAQEPLLGAFVVTPLRGQELQRDGAAELRVPRFVHHAHAAAAKLGDDVVLRNRPADQRVEWGWCSGGP